MAYRPSFIHNLVHTPLSNPSANSIQAIALSIPIPPTSRVILQPKLVIPRSHRTYYDYYLNIIPRVELTLTDMLFLLSPITNEFLRESRTSLDLQVQGDLLESVITILSETFPAVNSAKECKI
jgi:hypothetical protein